MANELCPHLRETNNNRLSTAEGTSIGHVMQFGTFLNKVIFIVNSSNICAWIQALESFLALRLLLTIANRHSVVFEQDEIIMACFRFYDNSSSTLLCMWDLTCHVLYRNL